MKLAIEDLKEMPLDRIHRGSSRNKMIFLYLAAPILAGILAAILKACKVPYYWLISGIFLIGLCAALTVSLDWKLRDSPYPPPAGWMMSFGSLFYLCALLCVRHNPSPPGHTNTIRISHLILILRLSRKGTAAIAASPTLDPFHFSGENPPHGHHPNWVKPKSRISQLSPVENDQWLAQLKSPPVDV